MNYHSGQTIFKISDNLRMFRFGDSLEYKNELTL